MAKFNFNAEEVQPSGTFDALPAGWYATQIIDSELKDTKAGSGKYLQFTHEVLDGPYAGRKIWSRLNVSNSNAEAERIGREQLSALLHAVGHVRLADTNELHGRQVRVKVTVRNDPNYGPSNEVKAFEPIGSNAPTPISAARPAAAASTGAKRAPWSK